MAGNPTCHSVPAGMTGTAESRLLERHGMISAALFYTHRNETYMRRAARVARRYYEETPLPDYRGTHFYPAPKWSPSFPGDDPDGCGLRMLPTGRFAYDGAAFRKLMDSLEDPIEQRLAQRITRDVGAFGVNPQTPRYAHGGMHWVGSFPRLLNEGFEGIRRRVATRLEVAEFAEERSFCEALLDTADGLITLARRCHEKLAALDTAGSDPGLRRLVAAFAQVPNRPARNFFEALLAVHFVMHLGCGEPGRLDQYLWPFYARDVAAGVMTPDDAMPLLEEHIAAIDQYVGSPGAWHLTLGGSDETGNRSYNELTSCCLKLNRRYRQPNTSLRVRPDMPAELWDVVLENLKTGCGNPDLVSEELYTKQLAEIAGVSREDLADYGFGGCTETLIQGKSAVDSIGSTYNLLDILDAGLGTYLATCDSFGDVLTAFKSDIRTTVAQLVAEVNLRQETYGLYWTDPLRTLLTDDCIERCRGYHEGGCRYNFEIVSVYGIANTVNSLYTLKCLYEGRLDITGSELLQALADNYEGHDALLAEVNRLDKFGNNVPDINSLAREITDLVFSEIHRNRCWRGNGHFLPASIGWTDFISLGKHIGATPDGRRKGEPLADSTGPTQGTDRQGPTQTLLSTTCVTQAGAPGTCVLNLMLDPASFRNREQREKLKALFQTYFAQGGCQLQINVLDAEVLQDAFEHPEKHANLFVRVAGYNDYYVKQSRDIQAEILERNRHRII